ncbi:BON domain-containing protein [Parvibaculum sp.]|jgi:osmotically-inducible protein OsmY|uniref:BON domain-containing protein n=1 Tax=Parvibaculum sp. TaxID=2024848 RepID=UPI000C364966|nr:BON domain-containing protein [Parvibaculum sp.]HAC60421.1 phospholipid-binding domain-containing protein [Rhodobiaceae bacterium]MAU61362.1 phospholipid-binding domain-containing protein [Parvibaculum sp.]MBO6668361.1 BON domain-containing protein [Parvibaculum sp.]MBO6692583.1 BON domain-containing protein [Parvibaculum sp.]MBO6714521.1 BON domain-containing protein [Parvibaculum sp.]|tara:strand:- start:13628 stop:14215 length:588 start_codon:yes stop_codon:yes gene_type:complete
MRNVFAVLAVAALGAFALGGCVPLIAGAGGAAAVGAAQDRGLEQAVDDNEIAFEINRKLLGQRSDLYSGVSTQVRKGRVLLTGRVPKQEDRIAVTRIVWSIGGVKEVINELAVGKEGTFSQSVNDTSITTKLRARLTGDSNVSGINYSIETVDGVVYLMGTARDRAELDRVLAHARDISGVRNVVSYVEVKTRTN